MGNLGLAVTAIAAVLFYPTAPAGIEKGSGGLPDKYYCYSTASGGGVLLPRMPAG